MLTKKIAAWTAALVAAVTLATGAAEVRQEAHHAPAHVTFVADGSTDEDTPWT